MEIIITDGEAETMDIITEGGIEEAVALAHKRGSMEVVSIGWDY